MLSKGRIISKWKGRGLIGDYEKIYERYMNTTQCDLCNINFTDGRTTHGKCMDHDHISGIFRNVVCMTCNNRLPKQKTSMRKHNTSGHIAISYHNQSKKWRFKTKCNNKIIEKKSKCKITLLTYKFAYLMINNYR
jgi:hypothetical protein